MSISGMIEVRRSLIIFILFNLLQTKYFNKLNRRIPIKLIKIKIEL